MPEDTPRDQRLEEHEAKRQFEEDLKYLKLAYISAQHSRDRSTQNGAVLVKNDRLIETGWNGVPPPLQGGDFKAKLERPLKYVYTEHAERHVIYRAFQSGAQGYGCTLYCVWYACPDCARAIIQSGIKRVVGHKQAYDRTPARWVQEVEQGLDMLKEAGVECVWLDVPRVFGANEENINIRFDGNIVFP